MQGLLCGRLFRFFLAAPGSLSHHFSVDADLHFKNLVVVWTRFSNDCIGRKTIEPSLAPLLDLRLVIVLTREMPLAGDLRKLMPQEPGDNAA